MRLWGVSKGRQQPRGFRVAYLSTWDIDMSDAQLWINGASNHCREDLSQAVAIASGIKAAACLHQNYHRKQNGPCELSHVRSSGCPGPELVRSGRAIRRISDNQGCILVSCFTS